MQICKNLRYYKILFLMLIFIALQAGDMYCAVKDDNHFEKGKLFLNQRDYESAAAEFEQAIRSYPYAPEIYYNLGLVYYRQHKFDESIRNFKKALELKPYFPEAQYNLGVVYDCNNQPEKAIEAYNQVIKLMPDDANLYFNIGLCEIKIGQYLEAKKKLNRAIQLDPQLADAYHNLGYLAELEGDRQLAASFYEKVISIDPTHKLANRNLKRVSIKKEKKLDKPTEFKRMPAQIKPSLSIGADLKVTFGKDVEFDNADNTISSKDFLGNLLYSFPNERVNVFLSFGLTSKDFDKAVNGNYSSVGFKRIIGPAYGGGINLSIFTHKELRFDSEISLLAGINEGEGEYKVEYDWMYYSIEAKATYHGFRQTIIPYAGISLTKLDGKFKLQGSSLNLNEADPVGLFVGAQYQYNPRVNFETCLKLIDETSLLFSLTYAM
ncbi:MAG: tetratricopeptide repeat protein [bacterium]